MKKRWLTLCLLGVLATPVLQAAYDGTVNIAANRPPNAGGTFGGGIFTVSVTSGLPDVIGGGGFDSFCLEFAEHITLPGNYAANLNNMAVGGSGGPVLPDPISRATAWLYSQFRAGTLSVNAPGYTYSNTGNSALQEAIWWLEHETSAYPSINAPPGSESSFNNYLVAAAVAATGAGTAANARTINAVYGEWGVAVLNLYTPATDSSPEIKNQDMLALVPEPTTMIAGALLLLPFCASTIRFIRKNRAV